MNIHLSCFPMFPRSFSLSLVWSSMAASTRLSCGTSYFSCFLVRHRRSWHLYSRGCTIKRKERILRRMKEIVLIMETKKGKFYFADLRPSHIAAITKTITITTQRECILFVKLLQAEHAHAYTINRGHAFLMFSFSFSLLRPV